jgi:hypothetical protein
VVDYIRSRREYIHNKKKTNKQTISSRNNEERRDALRNDVMDKLNEKI